MARLAFAVVAAVFLSACATNPVPPGYSGPLAQITDSVARRDGSSVDFFYLAQVNGSAIPNSLVETRTANHGRGPAMEPVVLARDVPAQVATYTIVGRTHHAMAVQSLTNTEYQVRGDVRFSPVPQGLYVVKGVLGEDYSAVWVEDAQTGFPVSDKVEIRGSAALGFFEK